MDHEMPKAYEPRLYEDALYKRWEEGGMFNPDGVEGESYSIMMPPPNVTGMLHLGHALEDSLMDAMARYQRLQGKKVLLMPGTDHAAIATQAKVEKLLQEGGMKNPRQELGREGLLAKIREFAEDSKSTILNQIKKMGTSADWSRLAYTFDEKRNTAVNTLFTKMYNDGLIYRGERMVNWDPKAQSTISDDEIVYKEEKTKFYYFQYGPFVIGTARPETKFGDKYVVMHPDDERYAEYKDGQMFDLEWINGPITATVVKDASIDMAFGTGVMTITPAHSSVDFEIAERHGLDKEQVIDLSGKLLPIAGEFAGMKIGDAREKIVEKLRAKGLVVKVEEGYVHNVATADRTGAMVEPQMMRQWWLDVNKEIPGRKKSLKDLMREAVTTGLDGDSSRKVNVTPDRFVKLYLDRVDNLRDWCLSRQIWWGHRIPVWYKGEEIVVGTAPDGEGWIQDEDTLDTWFSSGSWTFSTLGWPSSAKASDGGPSDLETFHPSSFMLMGYEILYLWLMRMILMSTYALNEIPFKDAYIHGILRDKDGKKFSKSSGNGVDPIAVINEYGCDALRVGLLTGNTPGNDSRYYSEKIESARNLVNKMWNISRFIIGNAGGARHIETVEPKALADRWILGRFEETVTKVQKLIEAFDFSLAIEVLREFTWTDFADWYLEIAKVEGEKNEILLYILERLLIVWHPFAPFVTEAIFEKFDCGSVMRAKWPIADHAMSESDRLAFGSVQETVIAIRNYCSEHKTLPKDVVSMVMVNAESLNGLESVISGLTKVKEVRLSEERPESISPIVVGGMQIFIALPAVDAGEEKARLKKEIDECAKFIALQESKLGNADFVGRAPEKVIAGEKKKLEDLAEKMTALKKEYAVIES